MSETGPPYPPPPAPGSNAIGEFIIGVSPIGDIPFFDPESTIVSQYANSPILNALIDSFNAAADETLNFETLFDFVWNVVTAQGFGLDVWGRIVGVSRTLEIAVGVFLGFQGPGGASGDSFNVAPFFPGGTVTSNFALTDSAFRVLIFAKALANISNGSVQSINQILRSLFPARGNCYCTDNGGMTMTYTFNFQLTPVEAAIVGQTGVLPKPVGVQASVVQIL